ncbi:hypothetical protein [Parasphingopyxis sp.]|uniref:hypothetical protein n=1 Tax=Parasphingopyxis sp. TaxID=1920299 RepID=UPI002638ADE7|nr:hypothetical protein [Parasphingopyxis sp.]
MSDTLLYVLIALAVLVAAIILLRLMGGKKDTPADPVDAGETPTPPSVADTPISDTTPEESVREVGPESPDSSPAAAPSDDPNSDESEPLTQIKGLGSKAEAKLNALGINQFDQIASWTDSDVETIGAELGDMAQRIARDRWVEQAGLLAAGDIAAFEAKFGKLG